MLIKEERVDVLGSILGDAMMLVLKIPGIFDDMMNGVNDKLIDLENQISEIKTLATAAAPKPTVKALPPPPDPVKEIEKKVKIVQANTRTTIIQELKDMFDFKKNLEKNQKKQD